MDTRQDAGGRTPAYVVGIGASAGGLDALERFFAHVPDDTELAFVVVQHLSPNFRSLMHELLARHTRLPIEHVKDGMKVEAGHVYLIPPKMEMIISEGVLLLSERDPQPDLSLPIDVFFRSLAQDCGPRAVAVVLSGAGGDGSRGVRAVNEAGGLVLVQDMESAQFDGMPRTAREAGVADWVLPPEEMPAVLAELVRSGGRLEKRSVAVGGRGFDAVYAMLEKEYGIDFTHYKPSTVTRRIERRLHLARAEDVDDYVKRLEEQREELDVLYRDLLIGVTRFFRNEEAFEILEHRVLPDALRSASSDEPFRVWVAGCATGEEVYSIAISILEVMARTGVQRPIKIFATDVHKGSLEIAARGIYDVEQVANVPVPILQRYFRQQGRGYQVVPEVRQLIVFAAHNVVKDAPFTHVDLITCRNLLIYLQPSAQQKVLGLFHFALKRGGIVFLGPSESAGALLSEFEDVDGHWRIYRKHSDTRTHVDTRLLPPKLLRPGASGLSLQTSVARQPLSQLLATYDALLEDVMPPSLLLNERGELLHSFGGASRFVRLQDGRQGLDVLDIVTPELKVVLVGGLQRARKEKSAVVYEGVRIGPAEDLYRVRIKPIYGRGGAHVLVSFDRLDVRVPDAKQANVDMDAMSREQIGALEAELAHTKENLQAAIEELETSNEELQAANEELLASNEELQSTNEELHSVNEELYSVNAEYQRKITELTELTNDMDNLLSSTDVGTVFLDRELKIRRFTPQIGRIFRLLPHDIGRPIDTFTHSIRHAGLIDDLRHVLSTGEAIERDVRDRDDRAFFLRILPYRANGAHDGVVLTLIDVTGLKAAEDALFHERHLLNSLLSNLPDAISFKDARGTLIRVNHGMARRLGVEDPRAAEGKTAFDMPNRDVAMALHQLDEAVLKSGRAQHHVLERREGCWDLATRMPITDPDGRAVGVIAIYRDVTEQVRADAKIKDGVRRRDQFLAMLSHELRNPLSAIVTATALLKAPQPERLKSVLPVLERQSHQMARLLDDLLEVSRVTENKINLRKRIVDLRSVARDAADAMHAVMEARGLDFTLSVADEPLLVDGDPARLQQIQVNLLSNAAKYTTGEGHVRLEVKRVDDQAVIRVSDDGMGMAPEMLDAIFDLFVQSPRTLDRSDGGLGVGLTLVKSLVEMHGGTVVAHSDGEGRGSEFVVTLPLAASMREEDAEPVRRTPRLQAGGTIVVVEDNADSRQMVCELLGIAGYSCHAAGDGLEGLALIERERPDVAIIDVGLPGIDGFELARRVRRHREISSTYLIALTGYGQPSDRAEAFAAGFDEHIVKPVSADALMRMLTEVPATDQMTA